ncbi:hypothetical protein B0J13DRAFT_584380 [Dactylonectria estremocensis]|uniref:GS catalytic domain-containing protein n=1 Tax=Dactylonectria estremocensis TaxID=1079267 RepID=A0A9P9EXB8_9HYPO|nr:hypothetical protein B0J13DRAFT_584380 [Dactylonectria estremocensis]
MPMLSITTEAEGSALDAMTTSLSHLRAVRQLADIKTCLGGIHSILIDDYLSNEGDNEAYDYFDKFTPAQPKRIMCIEHVATLLIEQAYSEHSGPEAAFSSFVSRLSHSVSQDLVNPVVPGAASFTRLQHGGLNEYIVHYLTSIISESGALHLKPIQFHMGLGYSFICNTRYIATVYINVYADIGEVFPIMREAFKTQVKKFIEDMLFHNSNKLYDLSFSMDSLSLSLSAQRALELPVYRTERLEKLLSENDSVTSPAGEWKLQADMHSLHLGPRDSQLTLMGDFKEQDGSPATICLRTLLRNTLKTAASHGISFLLGFEIEFILLKQAGPRCYNRLDGDAHAWCAIGATDHDVVVKVVEEAIAKLDKAGIHVEMLHPESAFSQYEIILPAAPALKSVDSLLYARQVISYYANAHGYKMTLHPKPFADSPRTAAYIYISISSAGGSDLSVYKPFYAGILCHLRSIIAFAYSSPISYSRIVNSCWASGTWVIWGIQNRETLLQKIEDSHWEFKSIDGLANPYLAMAAILSSGLDGILSNQAFVWKECTEDPASLTQDQRQNLNITERLPFSLNEALDVLGQDEQLYSLLGRDSVERYLVVKRAEVNALSLMDSSKHWQWVVKRY